MVRTETRRKKHTRKKSITV